MTTDAFASFREAVFEDANLMSRLRPPLEREAYVVHVVAVGAEHGFLFDAARVLAAMREGEVTWLKQGGDIV